MKTTFVLPINPEPWAIGAAFARRGGRGGGIAPNRKLVAFQQAVKAFLTECASTPAEPLRGTIGLTFYFFRSIEKMSYGAKVSSAHIADATNLQKGLEDALQGILFVNDNQVVSVESHIISQDDSTVGQIIIELDDSPPSKVDVAKGILHLYAKKNTPIIIDSNEW